MYKNTYHNHKIIFINSLLKNKRFRRLLEQTKILKNPSLEKAKKNLVVDYQMAKNSSIQRPSTLILKMRTALSITWINRWIHSNALWPSLSTQKKNRKQNGTKLVRWRRVCFQFELCHTRRNISKIHHPSSTLRQFLPQETLIEIKSFKLHKKRGESICCNHFNVNGWKCCNEYTFFTSASSTTISERVKVFSGMLSSAVLLCVEFFFVLFSFFRCVVRGDTFIYHSFSSSYTKISIGTFCSRRHFLFVLVVLWQSTVLANPAIGIVFSNFQHLLLSTLYSAIFMAFKLIYYLAYTENKNWFFAALETKSEEEGRKWGKCTQRIHTLDAVVVFENTSINAL